MPLLDLVRNLEEVDPTVREKALNYLERYT
jgi:hypothetical protein